jgi:hypothetical protein
VGLFVCNRVGFRIEDNLCDPLPISKINEEDTPMIPPAMNPPVQDYSLACMDLG